MYLFIIDFGFSTEFENEKTQFLETSLRSLASLRVRVFQKKSMSEFWVSGVKFRKHLRKKNFENFLGFLDKV